jgi:hypothetical protein
MKQTAVKWLLDRVEDVDLNPNLCPIQNYSFNTWLMEQIKLQALELEKQQIIDAYQWGRTDQHSKESKWYNRNAKKYYSETYKNKTE